MPEPLDNQTALSSGFFSRLWAWCRRHPSTAALLACTILMAVAAAATNAVLAARYAELKRENENLRGELDALRDGAPPRTGP
jgi:uncharacterized membrane protein YdfJ with MMPL/SSD domain